VQGRALTALHQLSNQFTGTLIKADLAIEPQSRQELRGKVWKLKCYPQYYHKFEENRINRIKIISKLTLMYPTPKYCQTKEMHSVIKI
jgi:hypothetical protein